MTTLQAFKAPNGHSYAVDADRQRTYDFGAYHASPLGAAEAALLHTAEDLDAVITEQGADQHVSDDPDFYAEVTSGEALTPKRPNRDAFAEAVALDQDIPVEFVYMNLNPAESDEWGE